MTATSLPEALHLHWEICESLHQLILQENRRIFVKVLFNNPSFVYCEACIHRSQPHHNGALGLCSHCIWIDANAEVNHGCYFDGCDAPFVFPDVDHHGKVRS